MSLLALAGSVGVYAQEPACAALPEPGRSCVDVILLEPTGSNQARTGVAVFGADDEPGNDSSGINHVVRTLDTIVYEYRFRVLHSDAQALRLAVTLPVGVELVEPPNPQFAGAAIPSYCMSGSSLVGGLLTCELGNVIAGTTRNATLRARPQFGLADGAVLVVESTLSATNQQSTGAVNRLGYQDLTTEQNLTCVVTRKGLSTALSPCGDVVSAKAQFDLELAGYATTNIAERGARNPNQIDVALSSSITTVVGGPAGRSGFILTYPVAIALPGDGVGAAPLVNTAPIQLTKRLSNSDAIPPSVSQIATLSPATENWLDAASMAMMIRIPTVRDCLRTGRLVRRWRRRSARSTIPTGVWGSQAVQQMRPTRWMTQAR